MMHPLLLVKPRSAPALDDGFRPAVLGNRAFREAVAREPRVPLAIALERSGGAIWVHRTEILAASSPLAGANIPWVERLVKTLLWQIGGFRIVVGGPEEIGLAIREHYAPGGRLAFDARLMSDVYDQPFRVEVTSHDRVPPPREPTAKPRGRHLNGCRIGFDAGASDHKVAAVVDGEVVFSEETPWLPSRESDPKYHYDHIAGAIRRAAARMPRLDGIGVSAAGVYVDNLVKVASLFRAVPRDAFQRKVRTIFLEIQKEWNGVPMEVVNDGDVAALAGSMSLEDGRVLGIALGSSEAGGYVTAEGSITSWLNELAFPPVDFSPDAPADEWSGDRGCGGEYFSQKAAIRLAAKAGIPLDPARTPAQQLASIQALLARGEASRGEASREDGSREDGSREDGSRLEGAARKVFESIGTYAAYGIAHYADLYDVAHVMLMGRVVSGAGGDIILEGARRILSEEFPELAARIRVHLPDEKLRRVGQAVAAASLPWIG